MGPLCQAMHNTIPVVQQQRTEEQYRKTCANYRIGGRRPSTTQVTLKRKSSLSSYARRNNKIADNLFCILYLKPGCPGSILTAHANPEGINANTMPQKGQKRQPHTQRQAGRRGLAEEVCRGQRT